MGHSLVEILIIANKGVIWLFSVFLNVKKIVEMKKRSCFRIGLSGFSNEMHESFNI